MRDALYEKGPPCLDCRDAVDIGDSRLGIVETIIQKALVQHSPKL